MGKVDPGLFTKELEAELLNGTISVAVHSLKDLPTIMPPGLVLAATLPRADTADVLIWKGDAAPASEGDLPPLPEGALIATSSLRRERQLLWRRPDLRVCEVRGNVGTRLRKLDGHADWTGLILARAGLERLGFGEQIRAGFLETDGLRFAAAALGPAVMLPAVGQGAIGLQARAGDQETLRVLAAINHSPTWVAVTAERALLSLLGGGCQLPLGVVTTLLEARGQMRLQAVLFGMEAGVTPRFGEGYGPLDDPAQAAEKCARELLD